MVAPTGTPIAPTVRAPVAAAVAVRFAYQVPQIRVEHVSGNGGLARTGDAGDDDEAPQWNADVCSLHVMQRDSVELQERSAAIHLTVRLSRMLEGIAQKAPGRGARISNEVLDRARSDHFATAYARSRSQVENVVGATDRFLVVLNDHQRVAMAGQLRQ